ncbi:BspA type Leucine rich repeat region (6 copies) [Popillia japonica]|uniref:BspA type Leucine rich repeat region (6 copies) n=1 Tax=Popillia japonica TaxID=7064 RepID=A0AAW1KHM5_POPJA
MCDYSASTCNMTFQNVLAEVSFDGKIFLQEHINGCLENRPLKKIFFKGFVPMLCSRAIGNMSELEEISLDGVGLHYVQPFYRKLPNLKRVKISFNPLYLIRAYVFSEIKLDTLDLSYNMIKLLGIMVFQHTEVNVLDLSHNRLESISKMTFINAKISELHIENNRIMYLADDVFREMDRIKKIYLNNNNIHHIQDYTFKNLGPIYLDLHGNDLLQINFLNGALLKHLDVSFNKISYLSLDNSTSIESMQVCPNPWHCQCLKEFWKYAENHNITIVDSSIQYDTKPICIAASLECVNNYAYDVVRDLYFKKFNYFLFLDGARLP